MPGAAVSDYVDSLAEELWKEFDANPDLVAIPMDGLEDFCNREGWSSSRRS